MNLESDRLIFDKFRFDLLFEKLLNDNFRFHHLVDVEVEYEVPLFGREVNIVVKILPVGFVGRDVSVLVELLQENLRIIVL